MAKKTETETTVVETPALPKAVVPTIGRVVLFHYRENQDRAAIITAVHDDGRVNLHVHMLVALDQRDPIVEVLNVAEGPGLTCWSWPPRV